MEGTDSMTDSYDTVPDSETDSETEYFEIPFPTGPKLVEVDSVDGGFLDYDIESLRELYPVVTKQEDFDDE